MKILEILIPNFYTFLESILTFYYYSLSDKPSKRAGAWSRVSFTAPLFLMQVWGTHWANSTWGRWQAQVSLASQRHLRCCPILRYFYSSLSNVKLKDFGDLGNLFIYTGPAERQYLFSWELRYLQNWASGFSKANEAPLLPSSNALSTLISVFDRIQRTS